MVRAAAPKGGLPRAITAVLVVGSVALISEMGGLAGGGRRDDWADRKSVTKIGLTPILAPLTKIPPFVTTGAG